jgi:hypothetical protein
MAEEALVKMVRVNEHGRARRSARKVSEGHALEKDASDATRARPPASTTLERPARAVTQVVRKGPAVPEPPPLPQPAEPSELDDEDPTVSKPWALSHRLAHALSEASPTPMAAPQTWPPTPAASLPPASLWLDGGERSLEAQPPPTTMVRLSSKGRVFAARGKNAGRLACAAAFIYRVANLIAADLGQRRCTAVHISNESRGLLVARSEVGDIAAASGSRHRLAVLLNRLGRR